MASPTGPDALINLKITHDGVLKKFKVALRDLGASTFEPKLRELLRINADVPCVFERYSDSAASFVVLNAGNAAVFKQLYRAAKAKQKLKLRVTTTKSVEVEETKPAPRPIPVTVEDVPEPSDASPSVLHVENAAAASSSTPTAPADLASPARPPVVDLSRHENSPFPTLPRLSQALPQPTDFDNIFPVFPSSSMSLAKPRAPSVCSIAVKPEPEVQKQQDKRGPFAVYCNSCDKTIPSAHYHCSICDGGDFDLCQACVDSGVVCHGDDHWLIKRSLVDGSLVKSTTERLPPKSLSAKSKDPFETYLQLSSELSAKTSASATAEKASASQTSLPAPPSPEQVQHPVSSRIVPIFRNYHYQSVRTCNNCVQEFPENEFVHCTSCFDFDLCKSCFSKDLHGHHPSHGFVPAVEGTLFESGISKRLAAGRNYKHNAICDGCDKFISGVRHKCLDCPDWDYCAECVVNSAFIHPGHRFVPIYEALRDISTRTVARPTHYGIHCDGPLCRQASSPRYISGDRFKCTICHDTDFCANCEASPANTHNKTHPLLKFKTPVRGVNVVTTGEHEDGKRMPVMGDRDRARARRASQRAAEPAAHKQTIAASSVRTVVDVQPAAPVAPAQKPDEEPVALFERDTVQDGTVMPPNHIFEQTWIIQNHGTQAWPAGCSVKFVGGDYMGHVDSNHPAGVKELVSAFESTVCYQPLAPGQRFAFTVLLRTPPREGKVISYWRLTSPSGLKFGSKLWCDVDVKAPKPVVEEPKEEVKEQPLVVKEETRAIKSEAQDDEARSVPAQEGSQMIFPKLEKESPAASIHESAPAAPVSATSPATEVAEDSIDDDREWFESEDGFFTDEEYDILDASDEEYLSDEHKKQPKK